MHADATAKNNEAQLSALEKMAVPEVLAFSQDALFGLKGRCKSDHLIVGARFENLVVWVSVLPPFRDAVRAAFPKGYLSYVDHLLYTSGFNTSDIMVAHWIDFFKEGQRLLNLALLSERGSFGTDREFALLPAEIM